MTHRSILLDPLHVPQKRKKILTEFPNGKNIPKEMQAMVGNKGLVQITNDDLHNKLMEVFKRLDETTGPLFEDREYELYFVQAQSPNTLVYDSDLNIIWVTKDSNPLELTPEYYK